MPKKTKAPKSEPYWKIRNREPKNRGIAIRASDSQLQLLRTASFVEEQSMQKILEKIVWPVLEENYGQGRSIHHGQSLGDDSGTST
jgi:hypothetical protein